MKKIIYAQPIVFANEGHNLTSDLEAGIDTGSSGYTAYIRYNTPVPVQVSPLSPVRIYRAPVSLQIQIPFNLGVAMITQLMTQFFGQLAGPIAVLELVSPAVITDAEPIIQMLLAIPSFLSDLVTASSGTVQLTDPDRPDSTY
jgi:hypothetical protein